MRTRRPTLSLLVAALALVAAACGSSHGATSHTMKAGTADVGFAGSLTGFVQTSLQPAFHTETGDSFTGKGEGSTALAQAILDNQLSPGAFVAVGKKAIKTLFPSRAHFLITLATDPLVVAYSPKSPNAAQLDAIRSGRKPLRDLFTLMATPGFRLARTNPNLDPQGAFFILMIDLAQRLLHLPGGTAAKILGTTPTNDVGSASQIVDEDSLPTDIASASFDAGSEYVTSAKQYKLDYIPLPPDLNFADPSNLATYASVSLKLTGGVDFPGDIITLNVALVRPGKGARRSAADQAADNAFVAFLLSSKGQGLLRKAGYVLLPPTITFAPGFSSAKSVLPSSVYKNFHRLGGAVAPS